ncbi:LOW QUALITY PROTEIN: serine/threonine-protein kinase MAK-like [Xyrichtys novacula]|uniref:LOW QUALITY PROTEIN: serine/threonine-protein kinase MAK-like n=1 Tax=Xyrichtys novacula TaxID=13765 RepID=A0AAV1HN35_XYRNO|nr:LOW QUALITY PROTEIN: serine/threonine-protein kinase MAK-like [Xyrichtys novacula]
MERYESLGLVGEGSYGTVLKCRHKDSGRLVAIKKFMDSDDDKTVKKIALREIKLLRQLRHDNLVNLLEVWKRRRRWYLVFEFVERTLLDDLEQNQSGLDLNTSRQYLYQILRAVAFCHQQNIIHRDIKPENILISQGGVVKLCDFGFARTLTMPADGGVYTDYVATRWYRAPELLVGDTKYGKPVDLWAVGCLLLEMLTGQPLFPGDSDLDQIYHIVKCFGNLTAHHQELFYRNPVFSGVRLPQCSGTVPLEQRFPSIPTNALDVAQKCLQMDPENRTQCSELLEHTLFTHDSFDVRFLDELNVKIQKDHRENSTLPKIGKTQRREKDEVDAKNKKSKDKKQTEAPEEKFNKAKEKSDKEEREDKLPKTKGKHPSKPKSIRNTSEPQLSTKQSKTSEAKIIDNASKLTKSHHGQIDTRSKPGKAVGAELRKEPEIPKPPKTQTFDSLDASKTATGLDENSSLNAELKNGKVASSEPKNGQLDKKETKERNLTGLNSSCSDNTVSSTVETNMMVTQMSSKLEPSQDQSKTNSKTGALQVSKSPPSHGTMKGSSLKPSLKSTIDGPSTASVPEPCKKNTSSKHHAKSLNLDTEQKNPKVLPPPTKPSKNISKPGTKVTKDNKSLPNSPLKSLTSDFSAQSSKVLTEESPANRVATLLKETLQTGTCLDPKLDDTTYFPDPPITKDLGGALIATTTWEKSCNTSEEDIRGNYECSTRSSVTKKASKNFETSDISTYSGDLEFHEPSSNRLQSTKPKITTESRALTTMPSKIPKTETPQATTIPKAMEVSDKENRKDLALSLSTSPSNKSSVDHIPKVEQEEPSLKSFRPLHSLMGEPETKLGSFSNHSNSSTAMMLRTQKTVFPTGARHKRDNVEKENSTNVTTNTGSTTSFSSVATPEQEVLTRISHNLYTTDLNEFNFSVSNSSPPPPPPPPSSTPLLLPPSATPLVPSISVVSTISSAPSNPSYMGTGFHPGLQDLRGTDKPRQLTQQPLSSHSPGSLSHQVPEKSQICEHLFQSESCNFSNTKVTKKKSNIHFPDLKRSVLGQGMHSTYTQKKNHHAHLFCRLCVGQ